MGILGAKVELAEAWRVDGNAAFQTKQFARAKACYEQGLRLLSCPDMCTLAQAEVEVLRQRLAILHVNTAACHLQDPEMFAATECENHCSKALQLDPSNVKAWYRRSQVYVRVGDMDKAKHDIARATNLEPTNAMLRKEQAHIINLVAAEAKNRKQLYQGAF
ncbi:hypothetical protein SPRG_18853 [Saprolegnia parasitica CBS 223.65]|uniref:peptidylprolyl isomerase n=1 Tax=Saprolegnia parasitica (strain CBS 223.65) TaxID=695850 RepID=A0A067CZ11_SAPPC|nr:hypothetical protein SPRG_18853 [Saprolegnia parasitica CBS 223.65]KDO35698.1 hypothetical protein SPRG_18853 [Saprolegnia parasitica CBS 223.65]|eukprot:XP_012194069.1 hypothetical protein SPRG_18853 [Saprolegnia parasitica CBS 223.65]